MLIDLDEPICPHCGHKMTVLMCGNAKIGPKEGDHTACMRCLSYLKIEKIEGKIVTLRIMTDDEFLSLPDEDRIKLTRIHRALSKMGDKTADFERHAALTELANQHINDITDCLNAMIEAKFGPYGKDIGCILVIRDMRAGGFQAHATNMDDKVVELCFRKGLHAMTDPQEMLKRLFKL